MLVLTPVNNKPRWSLLYGQLRILSYNSNLDSTNNFRWKFELYCLPTKTGKAQGKSRACMTGCKIAVFAPEVDICVANFYLNVPFDISQLARLYFYNVLRKSRQFLKFFVISFTLRGLYRSAHRPQLSTSQHAKILSVIV